MDTSEKTRNPKLVTQALLGLTVENLVTEPLTAAELKAMRKSDDTVCVCVALSLTELIDTWGSDGLNDKVEEYIVDGEAYLEELSYVPVGVDIVTHKVIVEVTAKVVLEFGD